MASEKEPVVTEEQSNGEKNGENGNPKLSLGEIAAIDSEIAKAKTDQLQLLHNLFYGKNGSAPQIKRNIRKFAGFETEERQKKLDQLLTSELPALQQTVTILDIKDIKEDETKENVTKAIVDFLMAPSGKTIAEVEKENPVEEEEEGSEADDAGESEPDEQVKPKGSPKKGKDDKGKAGRPKRATAARVWTKDYGSSEEEQEEEEEEEERPKVVGRKRKNDSDSGSEYNPNVDSDSEGDRRKSARAPVAGTRKAGRPAGRKAKVSESEESEPSDDDLSEDELPKKKKAPARGTPKRGRAPAKRGRKRKQESESDEESPDESEDDEEKGDSDDSEKPKKKVTKPAPKSTPQKNSKGRPKRAAPPAKKKKKDESESEEQSDEPEESEDDEPLKKPPKKGATSPAGDTSSTKEGPTDDDIKVLLKDILADANLEEITMKTVCKKVYAHYPGHDLTKKKDFIKQTVKSLIAT